VWIFSGRVMEDGPLAERAFETAEGSLDSCQQDIVAPDVFGTQVVAAAFEVQRLTPGHAL
jgi:hypothetical protein